MLAPLKFSPAVLLSWVLAAAADDCCQQNKTQHGSFLDRLFKKIIPPNYNYQKPPPEDAVQYINVSFLFFSISQVVFDTMEIEVEFLMHAAWVDNRLKTSRLSVDDDVEDLRIIALPTKIAQRLWIPRIIFPNCKHCSNGEAIGPDRQVLLDTKKRRFLTFYRDTMNFACAFELSYYPFDSHVCSVSLQLMDFSNRTFKLQDRLVFNTTTDHYVKSGMPPAFEFRSVSVKQSCSERSPVFIKTTDHCMMYSIKLQRIASYHLMLVYCPTTAIVIISWISFWLSVDAAAPRVTLGLTSLLTLTTQFANEQKNLPPVSYIKALDVWMLMCVFMVFGSLLEFTLAQNFKFPKTNVQNVICVKEEPKTLQAKTLPDLNKPVSAKICLCAKTLPKQTTEVKKNEVNWLDHKARVAFPLFFAVFNLFYWPCYATEY